ncbi:MAG: hypothetical protein GY803_19730 [Chloroflexi bacterium]|nr:hypothetical protein [Chloroflexota bacterium]
MSAPSLFDLQASVQDRSAFDNLEDYRLIGHEFLTLLGDSQPTRIVALNDHRYIFFQYGQEHGHKITRPLNSNLFIESSLDFEAAFERFMLFLADLQKLGETAVEKQSIQTYLATNPVNKIIYTIQQSIGSIGDSFTNPNQSRKRIGQLFENLIKLLIQSTSFDCESRTITVPIPEYNDFSMSYQLDLVFSRRGVVIASENQLIHPNEIIGSVKTTSKDRIDKIFLDKYLLNKLLGRDIPVIAIFLHDVQRAKRANSIFGINSTFKTNHFLGYTMALTRMNGVYYVDPRPEMVSDPRLNQEIQDFQQFLTRDLWRF